MRPSGRRVLYISYDGVLEPLGESQGGGYLERLSDRADISLLSFEKPDDWADRARMDAMRTRLSRAGIAWMPRRYHKRPPVLSTLRDIAAGCVIARRWAMQSRGGIVHARGYVPALIALFAKRAH